MAGGLFNLVSQGQQNIVLNGNPNKSFFRKTWKKYKNFGMQKFRIYYQGSKTLSLTDPSYFSFKVPRYADLLMDTFISVNLPNIWSPIFPPSEQNENNTGQWAPYEFKWIENIGAKMINLISITSGGQVLQQFSGDYLLASVQRDFSSEKKALFDKMIGNIPELNDPANANSRTNTYPNAYYTDSIAGAEPSIRAYTLMIPLNAWFCLCPSSALPLVALQYNEIHINIEFKPINQLFVIRDVLDYENNFPYVYPNFNQYYMQFYRFLQTPPDVCLDISSYSDTRSIWNADIHLRSNYVFISDEEQKYFAKHSHSYLIKQIHETQFFNVTGSNKIELNSTGMTNSFLFYFQRSDVNLRNEWSNYTNFPYNYIPRNVIPAPSSGYYPILRTNADGTQTEVYIGPGVNSNGTLTGLMITDSYSDENEKNILIQLGILLDGYYREDPQPVGVYNFVEKYTRTSGNAPDGLYCYNFCLYTSPFNTFPSGSIDLSLFNKIELEFTTINPPINPFAQTLSICDPETKQIIGINKPTYQIYEYNFNLYFFEERVNFIWIESGMAKLAYAL
uniref:Major capsid protein N-terminal domain-containing protein n=1 Tax=viral metagenome TaxID=1070528 RepID=A0A6C0H5G5_9ZZZZ